MSDDNREAAIKAVRHELNEVEALTEYSERGASNDPTYSAARLPDGERAALKAAWMAARARDPRGPEVIGGVAFRAGWFAARRYHGERDA